MSLINIKSDLVKIFDLNPDWISHIQYNPLLDIINNGKPYHLISLLRYVFGVKNNNPIMSNLRYVYYKEASVKKIFKDISLSAKKVRGIQDGEVDDFLDVLTLLAKVDYFKAYNKKFLDQLIKEIIASELLFKTPNIKHQASLIFLINRLGYNNVFIDRSLKRIQGNQNSDGGWPMCLDVSDNKSDIFSTLIVYRAFISNNLWVRKDFLNKAEKYLIQNHLSETQTREEIDMWNRLHAGYRKNNLFEGGSAMLLESLLLAGSDNRNKIKSIIAWLKGIQFKTGYFPYHADLKNQENMMSTIRILSLIKKYYIA